MTHDDRAIAIVGIGGVFPGAPDVAAFWRNIASGVDAIRDVPPGRWILPPDDLLGDPRQPDRVRHSRAGYVDARLADLDGLALDPAALIGADPLLHLTLSAGRAAWEDAKTKSLDPQRVGVILAAIALPTEGSSRLTRATLTTDFERRLFAQAGIESSPRENHVGHHPLDGQATGLPAALLARALNLRGGSYTLDAACASSLYSLKLASEALHSGRLDAVLAGGVSRPEALYTQMGFGLLQALSTSGVCRPFDAHADGLIVGEGAGVVVLKRLADAERDGDTIYGVIRAIGLSNDTAGSLLAADSAGQLRALRAAYREAGWTPGSVDYIECHGTGTPLGDAVELRSLATLWQEAAEAPRRRCALGSVKSMIGHLLTAAGAAGLIRTLLAMRAGQIPPSLHFAAAPDDSPLRNGSFFVPTTAEPWTQRDEQTPRRAAVSAFGFGGVNAHVLLEAHAPHASGTRRRTKRVDRRVAPHERDANPLAIVAMESRETGSADAFDFPLGRYRLPPNEISELLPQQLLMLDVAGAALAAAGRPLRGEADPRAGVIVGIALDLNTSNYHHRWVVRREARRWAERLGRALSPTELDAWTATLRDAAGPALTPTRVLGSLGSLVASRIAREFAFGGPSFTVSAGAASGLQALEIAAGMLRRHELDFALVGAIDLPRDSRRASAGRTPVNAAVAFALKRLDDALAAGDRVFAVVGEIATGTDDAADAVTFEPTATPDAGAAEGARALAGAVAALRTRVLSGDDGEPAYWWHDSKAHGPRRARVRAGTLDGGALCVTLTESSQPPTAIAPSAALFAVYGQSKDHLRDGLDALAAFRSAHEQPSPGALARAWHAHLAAAHADLSEQPLAVCLLASDDAGLERALRAAQTQLAGPQPARMTGQDGVFFSPEPLGRRGGVAFVFPGTGSHYANMGRGLATTWPGVMGQLEAETPDLRSQFLPDVVADPRVATPLELILAQVSCGLLASDVLRSLGVEPTAALGYSLGETTALIALRAWRDRADMLKRLRGSTLFADDLAGKYRAARTVWGLAEDVPLRWRVCVVNRAADLVRDALAAADAPRVYLLIVNAPDECVIGGDADAVAEIVARLRCEAVDIDGASTVHCPVVQTVADAYRALHELETTPPEGVGFYSTARAERYEPSRATSAASILEQAVRGFDFPRLIEQAYADGVRIFIEPGPGNACTRMIGKILAGRPHVARASLIPGEDEPRTMLATLATMVAERVTPTLAGLYGDAPGESLQAAPQRAIRVPLGPPTATPPLPSTQIAPATPIAATTPATRRPRVQPQRAAAAATSAAVALAEPASRTGTLAPSRAAASPHALQAAPVPRSFDYAACLEFARGLVGNILGPDFAELDEFPVRVRLPDVPLMLVDRILAVTGEPRSLTHGTIVTEHDVHADDWYLDHGRTPVSIAVESGQADLFLCSFLGIDHAVRGQRAYRLLDATIAFHRGLPRPGETIRYDIAIDRFMRQGDAWLFFFRFEATVAGEPLLTMTNGCAGFFTADEIRASGGIVLPKGTTPPHDNATQARCTLEHYDEPQLDALRRGDLAGCFGEAFAELSLRAPLRLPDGRMRLLHRIVALEPAGGPHGLGLVRGEADIHPDDWFLTCHFVDDRVMPGTLMYECCAHTLRVLLMRVGWVGEHDEVAWEPLLERSCKLKCRGPVTPETKVVTYEVIVKELGFDPAPYVVADAFMYADGRRIVQFTDMSLQLVGMTRARLAEIWSHVAHQPASLRLAPPPRYSYEQILAFSEGSAVVAFGERYRGYGGEGERRLARLPRPPYLFVSRITRTDHPAWELAAGGSVEAEYDVPPDAWYFAANRQPAMPFCVLLEIPLQVCGWFAAYMGSALHSPQDVRFRNLGGNGTLHRAVTRDTGTLTMNIRCTDISVAGGMIIERFDFTVRDARGPVYTGDTYFGFFTDAALAQQVGLRGVRDKMWRPTDAQLAGAKAFDLPTLPPLTPDDVPNRDACGDQMLPGKSLRMLDRVDAWLPDGGPHGLGYARGSATVDPAAWFFRAHFYQDPVWPGSLGLESLLQLLRAVAVERFGDRSATHTLEPIVLNAPHAWTYRGQILPTNKQVTVEAFVTKIEDGPTPTIIADGLLARDGLYIYEMKDFGLRLVPRDRAGQE